MPASSTSDPKFEIGHVLFIDIVGFSKLLINEQSELIAALNEVVRETEQVRVAEADGKLVRLPTGDGMALVFRNSQEAPVQCALEISQALKEYPDLQVRMGVHSGPVNEVADVNERANIAGSGINMAQRVMDCGEAGHILLSKRAAEDLAQYRKWQPHLHQLGECEVKHAEIISVVNLYTEALGNPKPPQKFKGKELRGSRDAIPPGRPLLKYVLIAVATLILGLILFRNFGTARSSSKSEARRGGEVPSPSSKSIAVLPFENLSRDPDNAYFADGIQDEILARLAKISELKVISRTSTQRYKSSPEDLPQIAKQLGVSNILEGSVQKAGDRVRVTVQLINARNDTHLWAETYDRNLTDIFATESEIATAIAETLQAKLTGSEQHALAARPTQSTEAHQLYLRGRYFWNKTTADDIKKAIDYFNQAIAQDPNYALAYVGLADSYLLLPFITAGLPQDCYPKAKAAAKKALEIDDSLAQAHIALAEALRVYDFDYAQASREFQRGLELDPKNADGHWRRSWLLGALGRLDEAIAEMKLGRELDPLSLIINTDLGYLYTVTGRYDQAIEQLHRTLEIDPKFYYAHGNLGEALEFKGDVAGALAEYRRTRELNDDPFGLAMLAHAYVLSGNQAEARKILAEMNEVAKHRYVQAYAFALVHLALGEKDEAIRLLEKSYQDHAGGDLAFIRIDPFLAPLRGDPRFEKLADKIVPKKK